MCQERRRPAYARNQLPAAVKARDGRCVSCGSTEALRAHHVVPIASGGSHTMGNLVTLCAVCHAKTHRSAHARTA